MTFGNNDYLNLWTRRIVRSDKKVGGKAIKCEERGKNILMITENNRTMRNRTYRNDEEENFGQNDPRERQTRSEAKEDIWDEEDPNVKSFCDNQELKSSSLLQAKFCYSRTKLSQKIEQIKRFGKSLWKDLINS